MTWSIVFSVITLYSTLGEEAVMHGICETDTCIVIASPDVLGKFKVPGHDVRKNIQSPKLCFNIPKDRQLPKAKC